MLNSARFLRRRWEWNNGETGNCPANRIKMAMVVVTTGPIIFLYPFVQKYFVAGIAIRFRERISP